MCQCLLLERVLLPKIIEWTLWSYKLLVWGCITWPGHKYSWGVRDVTAEIRHCTDYTRFVRLYGSNDNCTERNFDKMYGFLSDKNVFSWRLQGKETKSYRLRTRPRDVSGNAVWGYMGTGGGASLAPKWGCVTSL